MDCLCKATAEDVRVYAAVTTGLSGEAARRHRCGVLATAALGRVMTGALLLAANLKNRECLTVKFQGDGPLGHIVADASADGSVRGYVVHPEVELPLTNGKLSVGQGVGRGLLSVTRFTGLKEPVTGTCEIFSGEIAEDLTRYLFQSEQTPSIVGLGVLVGIDGSTEAAGGFIVQPLPGASENTLERLEQTAAALRPVSMMVKDGLSAQQIAAEILRGFPTIHFLSETELNFRCQCSRSRAKEILSTLCDEDLKQLAEDGQVEIGCDFCGEKYHFTKEEIVDIRSAVSERRGERI